METPVFLAVDLGTTHTVAVVGRGDQRPRPLVFGDSPLLPSGVFLDREGVFHTGHDATRLSRTEPDRYEPYPKRRVDDGTVLLGDRDLPVADLFAAILRRISLEVAGSGMSPKNVILTHPADWGPVRRGILAQAATQAGFDDFRFVAEPVAAAAYCTRELDRGIPEQGSVAVFDFGGGTFDVAVVRREEEGWRTTAMGGLNDLGGLDVDNTLVDHLGELVSDRDVALWHRIGHPETALDRRDRHMFWSEVRAGKEMLSRSSTAPVGLPGDDMASVHLTRDELTRLASPLIDRAVGETRRTLERAGVEPSSLTVLLLVGGSSRMPQVASALHSELGVAPFVPEQPELPVAFGALVYAMSGADEHPVGPAPMSGSPVFGSPVSGSPVMGDAPAFEPPVSAAPSSFSGTAYPDEGFRDRTAFFDPPEPDVVTPTAVTKRRSRFAIPAAVVLALLLLIAVVEGVKLIPDGGFNGVVNELGGDDADGDVAAEAAGLPSLFDVELSGGGAAAIAASSDAVIVGDVTGGSTEISAFSSLDGERLWSGSYELEPTDLAFVVVGDLLLVDATSSATDAGEDMRAVVSLADGEMLWKHEWRDRLDVAVYGTELVVEQKDGIYDNRVLRVDLLTGDEVWEEPGPDGLWILETRVRASAHWDDGEAGDETGSLWPNSQSLYDNLVAGPEVVDLDPSSGQGRVRDAGTGEVLSSGSLPLNATQWTVFEGFAVGRLSDDESPGRAVLAAYGLTDLKKEWEIPFNAGDRIEQVKPCGPQLVCAAIDTPGDDNGYRTMAVNIETGEEAWSLLVDWSTSDSWYSTADGLVFGNQVFNTVEYAQLLDFEGQPVRASGASDYVSSVRDGYAVFHTTSNDGSLVHEVVVVDTATGEATGPQGVGDTRPEHTVVTGDVVVVLVDATKVSVFGVAPV